MLNEELWSLQEACLVSLDFVIGTLGTLTTEIQEVSPNWPVGTFWEWRGNVSEHLIDSKIKYKQYFWPVSHHTASVSPGAVSIAFND